MPDSSTTKRALAIALKELMREKPLVKISIADIVGRCGMNRQSFYYHFRDKYDLVNWIFYTELITELKRSENASEWEELGNILDYLYQNRSFYINALKFNGQNSFYEYFGEVIYQILQVAFAATFEDTDQSEFNAMFYADALRACICRWLSGGARQEPDELLRKIRGAFNVDIREAELDRFRRGAQSAAQQLPWT